MARPKNVRAVKFNLTVDDVEFSGTVQVYVDGGPDPTEWTDLIGGCKAFGQQHEFTWSCDNEQGSWDGKPTDDLGCLNDLLKSIADLITDVDSTAGLLDPAVWEDVGDGESGPVVRERLPGEWTKHEPVKAGLAIEPMDQWRWSAFDTHLTVELPDGSEITLYHDPDVQMNDDDETVDLVWTPACTSENRRVILSWSNEDLAWGYVSPCAGNGQEDDDVDYLRCKLSREIPLPPVFTERWNLGADGLRKDGTRFLREDRGDVPKWTYTVEWPDSVSGLSDGTTIRLRGAPTTVDGKLFEWSADRTSTGDRVVLTSQPGLRSEWWIVIDGDVFSVTVSPLIVRSDS